MLLHPGGYFLVVLAIDRTVWRQLQGGMGSIRGRELQKQMVAADGDQSRDVCLDALLSVLTQPVTDRQ